MGGACTFMGSIRAKWIPEPLEAAVAEILFVGDGEFGDALLDEYVGIRRDHRSGRLWIVFREIARQRKLGFGGDC